MENNRHNAQLDIVEQKWSDITLDEAQVVLDALEKPQQAQAILAISGRPTASGALVQTERGNVFIKRYAQSLRDSATIEPYHRFAEWLGVQGIDTPQFLKFQSMDLFNIQHEEKAAATPSTLALKSGIYEVSTQAEGEDRYRQALTWDPPSSTEEAYGLGAFLAQLSSASEGFICQTTEHNVYENCCSVFTEIDIDSALATWLSAHPQVQSYLYAQSVNVARDIEICRPYSVGVAHDYAELPPCWTHGDPHISNFMWKNNAPCAVFDFGLAACNTAIFELVMALERHCIQWVSVMDGKTDAYRSDIAQAIIRGWASQKSITETERRVIPQLLPICQVQSALNWIGYYVASGRSKGDADWCYNIMFLAHTVWFASEDGRRFLDDIRGALNDV